MPGIAGLRGDDAGREHDVVEAGEIGSADTAPELQLDAGQLDPAAEIAQRLREFLLARECAGRG